MVRGKAPDVFGALGSLVMSAAATMGAATTTATAVGCTATAAARGCWVCCGSRWSGAVILGWGGAAAVDGCLTGAVAATRLDGPHVAVAALDSTLPVSCEAL